MEIILLFVILGKILSLFESKEVKARREAFKRWQALNPNHVDGLFGG